MGAVVQQESGGRPGVSSSAGAQGIAQVMPATGQAMARKLGLPWRPDLMTGTNETAAQYQRALGEAYLQEAMEANPGNLRDALRYYHGGPNRRMWGPKTNSYADSVISRLGGQ
ncbi:MAG: lytic transglycosylase domain-containing protein [Sphingomonas sp.]|uniref:lytic transglycosylase domain-containing protein n=1 Tax=Sphingomonas sp. TaxID=28214 RepID=UPI001B0B93AF|nr:lytic transglycosylase domain-containing protein [Sphingomonas sp.]MBO9624172.1 lytic transglycosylase domain-containing protein [Sphingomonas sp.]